MTDAPAYFEEVRTRAARRWDQLERDPVLAGPWHQLFKQVQSPRHIVSELLQNADDAGATMASVEIEDGDFVFTHNGEDFTEEHFTSLCRFGYSNIQDAAEGRFYHEDGSWIERVRAASFPWERYSASGELQQCYWAKDHCIQREPLQLEADVWELCDKLPDKYTLLLAALDGTPTEYSGHRIRELRLSGQLTLFPANYRLVFNHDNRSK